MNDILLYIRNFAYSHECMLYSNNAAMQKALSPSFVAIVERQSHCFSPIEELSTMECQRLASAAVTDTAETESGWQVSCVTANTTYTVSSQWLETSGVHVVQRTWSCGFKFNTVCVATWRTHCSGTNVDWTSGDPQGWRCSGQDRQVWKHLTSLCDITYDTIGEFNMSCWRQTAQMK